MASSLQLLLRFAPRPLQSSAGFGAREGFSELNMRFGLRQLRKGGILKLQYAVKEKFSFSVEDFQRSNVLDGSPKNEDGLKDFERQLKDLFIEVRGMLKMGRKEDALCLLRANYEVVKEQITAGFKGIEEAAILDVLALSYISAGDFKFAEHLLNMLEEIISNLRDGTSLVDSILMHMGSMYNTLGKFDNAIDVYQRGLTMMEKEVGKYSPFLVTPIMGMAKAQELAGRISEATKCYHQALGVLEKCRGAESEDLVVPLSALGNLLISEGKATDAEACFRRILDIYKKLHGAGSGKFGMAMCSLANALCAKGSINEAISLYEEGLQIIEDSKDMPLDDNVLEKMKTDLAELLHVAGREQEGRELLEECLLISERRKGIEHPSSLNHLLNIATSNYYSKNFAEAERLLRTCLRLMSKTVGLQDQSITVPMLHLAVTLYNLQQDEEAEQLALEVVRIRENTFGKESLPVGEALDCLVSIQTRLGQDDDIILSKLKRVLSIQEIELGYESEETVATLKKVVFYLDKMGKKDEKLPLQRRLSLLRMKHKLQVPV